MVGHGRSCHKENTFEMLRILTNSIFKVIANFFAKWVKFENYGQKVKLYDSQILVGQALTVHVYKGETFTKFCKRLHGRY